MKAVILAGGLGSRLEPFTQAIPKPLLPIGEKAVLEIQIERLRTHGFTDVFLATNYMAEYVSGFLGDGQRYGLRIHVSSEEEPLGTAGPIRLLKDVLDDTFLVMNGDILTLANLGELMERARTSDSILTLGIKKEVCPFDFGNIHFSGDYVTGIEEKPDITMYMLAGIYAMKPAILDYIPEGQYYGMDVLIQNLLQKKVPVAKYEIMEYWLDIGRLTDYREAQEVYYTHFSEQDRG